MKVEIWSDVVCPWCYIGKRRFEAALARFAHARRGRGGVAQLRARPDHASPRTAAGEGPGHAELIAAKYGMPLAQAEAAVASMTAAAAGEGLDFHLDALAALQHLRRAPA